MNIDSMSTESLIEFITQEVMKRVDVSVKEKVEKEKILALSFSEDDMLNINTDFFDIDRLEDIEKDIDIDSYKYILLGNMSNKEMIHISMGLPNDRVSSVVIDCIFRGKKVHVLKEGIEYHKYKKTCNTAFYNMMKDYESKIKSFGIDFINKSDVSKLIDGKQEEKPIVQEVVKNIEEYDFTGKIITEATIKGIYQSGYKDVSINKKTKITPLAKDYIRSNSINIFTKSIE